MQKLTDEQAKDQILKNCFTAYLATTVHHRRADFLRQSKKEDFIQEQMEIHYAPQTFDLEHEILRNLPIAMSIENEELLAAFLSLEKREQYVLLKRIVDDVSLDDLALEMGLTYKGASAAYYRVVNKLKRKLKGSE